MFGAIGGLLGGGGLIGSMLDVGKMLMPGAGIAGSLINNLMGGAIGDAVKGAVDQLCKDAGMPKFIGDIIKSAVDQAVGQHQQHCGGDGGGLGDKLGKSFGDFSKSLMKDITDAFQQYKSDCRQHGAENGGKGGAEGGGKGGKSWFVALMKALGEVQNQQAAKLEKLSKEVSNALGAGDGSSGSQQAQFDKMEEFKAESKLQEVLANVTKSIGDAIGNSIATVARSQ